MTLQTRFADLIVAIADKIKSSVLVEDATLQIINRCSSLTTSDNGIGPLSGPFSYVSPATLCGSMTNGVYKTLIDITGGGVVHALAVWAADTVGGRTISLRVTVDDSVAFNAGALCATANYGMYAVGAISSTTSGIFVPVGEIKFNSSLKVEIMMNETSTDKAKLCCDYQLRG